MPPSKQDFRARFDQTPEDIERQEAQLKAAAVRAEVMTSLQNHEGWQSNKIHCEELIARLEKEKEELRIFLSLAAKEEEMRILQLKHAYKQGYTDGMKTVLAGPADLAKSPVEA